MNDIEAELSRFAEGECDPANFPHREHVRMGASRCCAGIPFQKPSCTSRTRCAKWRFVAADQTPTTKRELCLNLGDGADQAAWLCLVGTTSMPSANLTPATIFGN
jgi:hypothetical protein